MALIELRGKTALLTGATGGLGRAIAESLAGRGATLVLSSRKEAELSELAASLPGEAHRHLVADLAQPGAAKRLAGEAGDVDVLVANAGIGGNGRLEDFSSERIELAVRVNVEAPIQLARALVESMRDRGSGHLAFISSLAGKATTPGSSLYSATKFGLRGFALGLRQDLAQSGVGVSAILPGYIRDAGMFAASGADPGAMGTSSPREVGEAVADAIERDRGEVEIAPFQQRLLVAFAHRRPHLAAALGRRAANR